MMSVTDEKIIERLRAFLAESDLQTTTEKMLRMKLEEEFGIELKDKKQIIRKEIEDFLEEQAGQAEQEEGNTAVTSDRRRRGLSSIGAMLSEPLQKFLGEKTLPRTQVVKRLWDYIKLHNLQDPSDRRKILLDEKLRTLFRPPLTMFSMSKQLSRHVKTAVDVELDEEEPKQREPKASGDKRAASDKSKAEKPKEKKAKTGSGGGPSEGETEKRQSNFNKPVKLSKELSSWCGTESIGRADLTKFFWTYIKEHNLQDPANKQFILCDAQLKKLTGESRIQAFAFQKYVSGHLLKD